MIGQLLSDRYKIIRVLSAGGMGQTYVAEDTQRPGNPTCVVKQLKPASQDPNFLATARRLFVGEAESLEKLGNHDQIPRLLAYFERDQDFYLVQELIDGHPLSTEMPLGQRWDESQVLSLLQDLLHVLEFVHSQGVIHRDIKPDNIIRRKQDGKLVLIDFGAMKQVQMHQTSASGQVSVTVAIGTPGYMPTEQSSGKPRASSDLYALGMVAIQALTGLLPVQLREDEDGEAVWQDQAEVSDSLAAILTKMVRHYFKHRYQSASEVLQALKIGQFPGKQQIVQSWGYIPNQTKTPYILLQAGLGDPTQIVTAGCAPTQANSPSPYAPTQQVAYAPTPPTTPQLPCVQTSIGTGSMESSTIVTPLAPPSNPSRKWLHIGMGLVTLGVLGVGSYWGYTTVQHHALKKAQQNAFAQIETLKADQQWEECITQARAFPYPDAALLGEIQTLLDDCQLGKAQQFATEGRLKDAIATASEISSNAAVHDQAQSLIYQWADRILTLATERYEAGQLKEAIALAQAISDNTTAYGKAQAAMQQWNADWQANEKRLQAAQTALDQEQWQSAIDLANQLTTTYWVQQGQPILEQAQGAIAVATRRAEVERQAAQVPSQPRISSSQPSSSRSQQRTSRTQPSASQPTQAATRPRPTQPAQPSAPVIDVPDIF